MVVCLRWLYHHKLAVPYIYIYISQESFVSFLYYCAVLWCAQIIKYITAWQSYSLIQTLHYPIIIIMQMYLKYWTSKMLVRYVLFSVCLRLSELSQLPFMQYMELYVFSLPISLVLIVRICACMYYMLSSSSSWNWKYEPFALLRARSWNKNMHCMSFIYVLMEQNSKIRLNLKRKKHTQLFKS